MNLEATRLLYDYNYWANHRLLEAAARVNPAQFVAPAAFPYGGLRGTLVHILEAEWGWRVRCQHNESARELLEAEFPTLRDLRERWREEEQAMRAYLASLRDEALPGIMRYMLDSGERRERVLWHALFHVVNHGTQHRSEAAALLTEYGASPGDLDFTVFLLEQAGADG